MWGDGMTRITAGGRTVTRIEVTQRNIDDAHRHRDDPRELPHHCSVALAAKHAGVLDPNVSSCSLRYKDADGSFGLVSLPSAARQFINTFDSTEYNVEPFWFEVCLGGKP